jgi:hypothetical protein
LGFVIVFGLLRMFFLSLRGLLLPHLTALEASFSVLQRRSS